MANFTPQQAAAIYTLDQNLVVAAGAGSGKTRVLVERYIELLDQHGWALNAIVAITFTREAALEMRNRVRAELEKRLRAADEADLPLWSGLMGQMDSARIDTIHGLCAMLLRQNAAEAQLDPAFEVMDEVDTALLLTHVIDDALNALAEEGSGALPVLLAHYDADKLRAALHQPDLMSLPLPTTLPTPEALWHDWQAAWQAAFVALLGTLEQNLTFRSALAWLPPGGVFPEQDKLTASWLHVQRVRADLFNTADPAAALTALAFLGSTSGINLTGGSQKNWGDKSILDEAKAMLRLIRAECEQMTKTIEHAIGEPPGALDKQAAAYLPHWYTLISRVQAAYRAAKQEQGVLDFGDLERLTADLLRDHPAVRERYRTREFKAILVDEFQDTNDAQWEIVQALGDLDAGGSLFVVGDLKQSIYGFRGADVRVFSHVRRTIAARACGQVLALSESFRSHRQLIATFNDLFERILAAAPGTPPADYEILFDEPMTANRTDSPDYVPFELILLDEKQPDGALDADTRRTWEAALIAQRLQQWVAEGTPIWDRSGVPRAFGYGDAALLFQSTNHIQRYEAVFKAFRIPFVTVAGRGYYNRQEVWDVLNLLKALHNPLDHLALAVALRSPLFGLSDDALLHLRRMRLADSAGPLPLWEALGQIDTLPAAAVPAAEVQRIHRVHALLHELRLLAGRVTIAELLRQLLARTGYLAVLTGLPDGVRRRRNVEKLIEIAAASGRVTPGSFWRYLDDLTAQEVREGEALLNTEGAVRLMTIHASKGLEFPVVFLPDAGWTRTRAETALLFRGADGWLVPRIYDETQADFIKPFAYRYGEYQQGLREAAERKRLLYVAATRARDRLIISGKATPNETAGWQSTGWMDLILNAAAIGHAQDGDVVTRAPDVRLQITVPLYDPHLPETLADAEESAGAWDQLDARSAAIVPAPPPLLPPIVIPKERFLTHLAATQLADLGATHHANMDEREFYVANVRRMTLEDTPASIKQAVRPQEPRVTKRIIGDIVHEALRYWRFPDTTDGLRQILRSYAWQQHLTAERDLNAAVEDAVKMLAEFKHSQVYAWITATRKKRQPVYTELPFILRAGERILHGVIDVLFKRGDGLWVVVDYKTASIDGGSRDEAARNHALRYALQVGAYAAAVRAQLGIVPEVYIHYLRYNKSVHIPADLWQAELQKLDAYIGAVIGSQQDETPSG